MRYHYTKKYLLNPPDPVTIDLVGCGGTGSQVLSVLARIDSALVGLGHQGLFVRAYDPDMVQTSNLGRQLFSPSDLNLNKAAVLITRINRFYGLNWCAYAERYGEQILDDSPTANFIVSCVDTGKDRVLLGRYISELKNRRSNNQEKMYYWLDFGNQKKTGQVILGTIDRIEQPKSELPTVDELPTIIDVYPEIETEDYNQEQGPSCSLAEALSRQDLMINSILAQCGMDILWKMFRELRLSIRGIFLNLERMTMNPIRI